MILFVDGQEIGLVLSANQPPWRRVEDEYEANERLVSNFIPPTTLLVEGIIYDDSYAPRGFRLEHENGRAIEGRAIISAERAGYRRGAPMSTVTMNCQELTLIDAREVLP